MADTFNVLNLDNYVREYMKEKIKGNYPDMDTSENSVFDDVFIKPMITVLTPMFERIANTEMKSNLKYASVLTETEIEDIGANNYAVYRSKGDSATVVQTFGFSKIEDKGIVIPEGVVVTDSSGLIFTTTQSTRYTKAEAKRCFNSSTQTYDVTAPAKAAGKGSTYNVGANTLTICQTQFSEYLAYTTNELAATNGQDDEPIEDYLYRIVRYWASQHLGTEPGYENLLREAYPGLDDIRVIGKDDDGMERDIIEVVARDADGSILFRAGDDDKMYAQTTTKHIGGCVDIYVRGSEYSVQTKEVPLNSNIIEIEGGVVLAENAVMNAVSKAAVKFNRAYLSNTDAEAASDSKYGVSFTYHKASLIDSFDESRTGNIDDHFTASGGEFSLVQVPGTTFYGVGRAAEDASGAAITIDYQPDFAITAFSLSFLAKKDALSGISIFIDDTNPITPKFQGALVGKDEDGNEWCRYSTQDIRLACKSVRIQIDGENTYQNGILEGATFYESHTGSDSESKSIANALSVSAITSEQPYAITTDLTIPKQASGYFLSWSTDKPDVLDLSLGTITRQGGDTDVELYGEVSYAYGTQKLLADITYTLRVKDKDSNTWSVVTSPEHATKTLIYIAQTFSAPTSLEVSYTIPAASEDDVDQNVTENYTVGYDTTELSAPISGGVLSAYYTQTAQWTQKNWADWAEQTKVAFGIDLAVAEEPTDELAQDFSDTMSITKYNISLTQELLEASPSADHQFDKSYIGSSQERAFLNPYPEQMGEAGNIIGTYEVTSKVEGVTASIRITPVEAFMGDSYAVVVAHQNISDSVPIDEEFTTFPRVFEANDVAVHIFLGDVCIAKGAIQLPLVTGSDFSGNLIAQNDTGYLYAMPNSSVSGASLSVRVPYNKTLSEAHDLLYSRDSRIITTDVLVKEAEKKPVNVGILLRTQGDSAITSLNRSQIYAAIETLFSDAGINGRVEQSDIVGKLYTDQTTSNFVEYVRLPLAAFYVPEDTNAEVEIGNVAGDYIKAGAYETLYLNKVSVVALYDEEASNVASVNVPSMTFIQGTVIAGTKFRGYGFDNAGTPVSGTYTVKDVVGQSSNVVAVAGTLYDVNLIFVPDNPNYASTTCTGQGLGVEE